MVEVVVVDVNWLTILGLLEYPLADLGVVATVVNGNSEVVAVGFGVVEGDVGLDRGVVTLFEVLGVDEVELTVLPLEVTALAFVLISSVDAVENVLNGRGVITLTVVDGPSVVVLSTFTLNRGASYLSFRPFSVVASNLFVVFNLFS